jgi:hypothetical protein
MKFGSSKIRLFMVCAIIALLSFALSCATLQNRPANASSRGEDVEFVSCGVQVATDRDGYTVERSICTLRMRNVGSEPIRSIKFRLTLRDKSDGQLVYSRVHKLNLNLMPRDTVTKTFYLQEFCYNIPYDFKFDELEVW